MKSLNLCVCMCVCVRELNQKVNDGCKKSFRKVFGTMEEEVGTPPETIIDRRLRLMLSIETLINVYVYFFVLRLFSRSHYPLAI